MRNEMDRAKLETFMAELGKRVRGPGTIYVTGGATALWYGWRAMTVDVDIKPDPEPAGLFEALAALKNELNINIELAAPDQFIPAIDGWQERSLFIARHGSTGFFHYDPYGQALSKLSRRYERDLYDVRSMLAEGLITTDGIWEKFARIEPQLIRYPVLDAEVFRANVKRFCDEH